MKCTMVYSVLTKLILATTSEKMPYKTTNGTGMITTTMIMDR